MSILISVRGAAAERLDPLPIEQENLLQEDILKHPETIPLHELKDGIRFTVLCREFPTQSISVRCVLYGVHLRTDLSDVPAAGRIGGRDPWRSRPDGPAVTLKADGPEASPFPRVRSGS
jgi:hypothetical protein